MQLEDQELGEFEELKVSKESRLDFSSGEDRLSNLGEESPRMKVFSERTDVVLKTILRAFRKFYAKSFNDLTDYKKLKRRVTFKNN